MILVWALEIVNASHPAFRPINYAGRRSMVSHADPKGTAQWRWRRSRANRMSPHLRSRDQWSECSTTREALARAIATYASLNVRLPRIQCRAECLFLFVPFRKSTHPTRPDAPGTIPAPDPSRAAKSPPTQRLCRPPLRFGPLGAPRAPPPHGERLRRRGWSLAHRSSRHAAFSSSAETPQSR